MQWLGARQVVISENIANADTPDYKSKDVGAFDAMMEGNERSNGLRVTKPNHIQGAPKSNIGIEADTGPWEQSLDGNTVSLEQQTIKAAEVSEGYKLAASLYRKGHDLLTLAVTGIR
ncbi:flagellar basal body rod protein FlgB [Pseudooceanicola sp. LIPI14-2-Ac024]|uniref:flagellar basal body rod protein FlgB n=1 Tax=Pseudooceanicola sp. LIPI14-2-Ac024 TaxID=3344875 RepID=UPI0035D05CE7